MPSGNWRLTCATAWADSILCILIVLNIQEIMASFIKIGLIWEQVVDSIRQTRYALRHRLSYLVQTMNVFSANTYYYFGNHIMEGGAFARA